MQRSSVEEVIATFKKKLSGASDVEMRSFLKNRISTLEVLRKREEKIEKGVQSLKTHVENDREKE